jgi:hypothetical protein
MSFDHWWFSFLVDDAEYRQFLPAFSRASKQAVLSEEASKAVAAWRERPEDFEHSGPDGKVSGDLINAFLWAFNLPGFDSLGMEFLSQEGEFVQYLTPDRFFRFVSIPRNPPVSVLWHSLGYERANDLPGAMGNLLVMPDEATAALERVSRAYRGTSTSELVARAKQFCGADVYSDETLVEAITHLPDGLEQAVAQKRGFLSIARSQT